MPQSEDQNPEPIDPGEPLESGEETSQPASGRNRRQRSQKLPKQRRKARRNPFVVLLSALFSLLFLGALVVGGVLYAGKVWFEKPGPLAQTKTVVIPRGRGVQSIAKLLKHEGIIEDKGIIDQTWIFAGGLFLYKAQGRLQAGEYEFEPGISMHGIMDKLTSGKAILHG